MIQGLNPGREQKFYCLQQTRPPQGPTQPPVQSYWSFLQGGKGSVANNSPLSSVKVKNE